MKKACSIKDSIRLWNKTDVNHILNEGDKEVEVFKMKLITHCKKKKMKKIGFFTERGKLPPIHRGVINIEKSVNHIIKNTFCVKLTL